MVREGRIAMQSGADIRKYRKALKLSQREFSAKLKLSQATLSLTESGKIGVSNTVTDRLRAVFNKPEYKPRFDEFCRRVDSERKGAQRVPTDDAIAFEMPNGSGTWIAGEILVFRTISLDECSGGELCLIQHRRPRSQAPSTIIATLRRDSSTRRRSFGFEPGKTEDEPFAADPDRIEALLRCIYRARYLR
jgi:transcriptional regulator with XRE-family HTH domain